MKYLVAALAVLSMTIDLNAASRSNGSVAYLENQAKIIKAEGGRIKKEADRMRSESGRLEREAKQLRLGADRLDAMWTTANQIAPEKFADFPGRDKSQIRMRLDAGREEQDASSLRVEGLRLDDEAARLWKLSEAVNAQARKDLIDLFRGCCKSDAIEFLRQKIVHMARELNLDYVPAAR